MATGEPSMSAELPTEAGAVPAAWNCPPADVSADELQHVWTVWSNDQFAEGICSYMPGTPADGLSGDHFIEREHWVKWRLDRDTLPHTMRGLVAAARHGALDACKWLCSPERGAAQLKPDADTMQAAVDGSHSAVVLWCVTDHGVCPSVACMRYIAGATTLDMDRMTALQVCVDAGGFIDTRVVCVVAGAGDCETLTALLDKYSQLMDWTELVAVAARCRQHAVMELVCARDGFVYDSDVMLTVLESGAENAAKRLIDMTFRRTGRVPDPVVCWVCAHPSPSWSECPGIEPAGGSDVAMMGMFLAAAHGNLRVLEEWHTRYGCPLTDTCAVIAARNGHLHVLEWLCSRMVLPHKCWESAARYGNGWSVLCWAVQTLSVVLDESVLDAAIDGGALDCALRLMQELHVLPTSTRCAQRVQDAFSSDSHPAVHAMLSSSGVAATDAPAAVEQKVC